MFCVHRLAEPARLLARRNRGCVAVFEMRKNARRRAQRRHEVDVALFEERDRLVVEQRAVFDRIDAGAQRVLDALRADRVRGDSQSVPVRLVDRGAQFVGRELRVAGNRAFGQHAAGRDQLDAIGAGPHLLAHALCAHPTANRRRVRSASRGRRSCRARRRRRASAGRGMRPSRSHRARLARCRSNCPRRGSSLRRPSPTCARSRPRATAADSASSSAIMPIRSGSPLPSRCACAFTNPGVTHAASRSHSPLAARISATHPSSSDRGRRVAWAVPAFRRREFRRERSCGGIASGAVRRVL